MANLYNTFNEINSSISGVNNFFDFTTSSASLTGNTLTLSGAGTTINGTSFLNLRDGNIQTASFQTTQTYIGGSSQGVINLDANSVVIDGLSAVNINNGPNTTIASFQGTDVNIGSVVSNKFGNNSATNKFGVVTEPLLSYHKINYFGSSEAFDADFPLINYFGTWSDYTGPVANYYGKGNIQMFNFNTESYVADRLQPLDLQLYFDELTNSIYMITKKLNGDIYGAAIATLPV